ncbi:MAG TPA: ABC transporter substrate-binding protein [Acidimicrobiales bacterium]|nr:ABC transporter substrate-binding protein [Acidimicrobiales bacterium]
MRDKETKRHVRSLTTVAIAVIMSLGGVVAVVGAGASNIALGTDAHKTTLTVGKGALRFNVFAPFTGPDARFGEHGLPGAEVGAYVINSSGGIMGRKIVVTHTDSRGDPADAVPALQQMLATTSNLEAVLGPTSDESLATIPLLRREGVPTFDQAGSTQLDGLRSKWVYRILASDSEDAVAMSYQAVKVDHAQRVALVFASDAGSQSLVAPLQAVLKQMHATVVANVSLTPDQPSYSTEVLSVEAAKPDVILTETDDATAATLWSEMYQLSGLHIKIIGSGATTGQDYFQAVQQALGSNITAFQQVYSGVSFSTLNTCATPTFLKAFHTIYPGQQPVLGHVNYYDSMLLIDFAMHMAKSFNPNKWVPEIRKITNAPKGAVRVCTLAQGLREIKLGKRFTYIGTKDSMVLNKSNTVTISEEAIAFDNTGLPVVLNQLTLAELAPFNSGL